jgi:hypothetical protein
LETRGEFEHLVCGRSFGVTRTDLNEDIAILVADKNMEHAVRGLLDRPAALGIRPVRFSLFRHPENDPGCRLRGHDLMRPLSKQFQYALVMFDREGCGRESATRDALETEAEAKLEQIGWQSRCAAIIFDPELEVWIWSESPHVESVLGWQQRSPNLRQWLQDAGHWTPQQSKPDRPKEALENALREVRKPRSSSIYFELANRVSLQGCVDPAFAKLRRVLNRWFQSPT